MQHVKLMLAGHLIWLSLVLAIGTWWGQSILDREAKVVLLQKKLGDSTLVTEQHLARTRRMLFWESGTYFLLLTLGTVGLFLLYSRDMKRAKSVQAFFASLTHELKTPLASIRLQAEAIHSKLKDEKSSHLIQRLLEDTSRLESQVERVLELARVEGGGQLYPKELRAKVVIEKVLRGWEENNRDRVEISADLEDATILFDQASIHVIFKNLLENSLRHARTASESKMKISIQGRLSGERYVVRYADSGPGFCENKNALGEIYFKGEKSQGAGVGLYLIKSLMEQLGGEVTFSNEAGFPVVLGFKKGEENGDRTSEA